MSNTRLVLQGLTELREALRQLPRELAEEAAQIVTRIAEEAKADIVAAYPEVTGNLRGGVTVYRSHSGFVAKAIVRSRAPHAHLYEFGSQVRYTKTGASRGAMPPKPTFIPIAIRKRREMYAELRRMLEREAFQVSGDA